jgi:predicted nucleotidyltransferase
MTQNETFGLKEITIHKINSIFIKYSAIEKAILYGSRAKGNYKNGSDIDITLIGDSLTYKLISDIENDLDELYLPYTFDLSIYKFLENDKLTNHIDRVGKVFYESVG